MHSPPVYDKVSLKQQGRLAAPLHNANYDQLRTLSQLPAARGRSGSEYESVAMVTGSAAPGGGEYEQAQAALGSPQQLSTLQLAARGLQEKGAAAAAAPSNAAANQYGSIATKTPTIYYGALEADTVMQR